jgi:hypothetical protein
VNFGDRFDDLDSAPGQGSIRQEVRATSSPRRRPALPELRAFAKLDADQMRTKRRTGRSDQTELPFENPPEQGTG